MVTGLVVRMIGLSLMRIGVEYAAGGVAAHGTAVYSAGVSWFLAGVVVAVTLGLSFFARHLVDCGGADRAGRGVCGGGRHGWVRWLRSR